MAVAFALVGGIGQGVALAEKDKGSTSGTQTLETRPGNGCGDRNHVHTGAPGNPDKNPCRSVTTTTRSTTTGTTTTGTTTTGTSTVGTTTSGTTTTATTTTGTTTGTTTTAMTTTGTTTTGSQSLATRPGNGFGDDNHIHTGPPGRSDDSRSDMSGADDDESEEDDSEE